MEKILICYVEDTRELLVDALNDQILKLEAIKRRNTGKGIDTNKLPGIFHYHRGIDGYIKDVKNLRNEIKRSPLCAIE